MAEYAIIIDTDPGIDDAMAIFYALGAAEIDVLALTTVYGNVGIELTTTNALRLLEVAGRADIPVARGSARPLTRPFDGGAPFVHGADGQGDAGLPQPTTRESGTRATQLIYETVAGRPGEVTIVTLGPLTNLALLLIERPEIVRLVRGVVAMGGNVYAPGNASPTAEANILNDPEAAEIVLAADWPVTLIGLDVTHRIEMTPADLQRMYRIDSARGRLLAQIVPSYHAFYEKHVGSTGIYVHDSTTISFLRHPDAFTTQSVPVVVDTSDGVSRGKTWPMPRATERRAVTVATDADARRLIEAEMTVLEGAG
jgi:inosine-uridine nucleoside N-ribohydrolase